MKRKSFAPPGCVDPLALAKSIGRDIDSVSTQRAVSYDISYPEFLRYFRESGALTRHNVVIAANFAYGWMPTILKSLANELDDVIDALERARRGELLQPDDIKTLSRAINGSTVGASKVLHFAAPSNYAIWDSRVATYLGTTPERGDTGVAQYCSYNDTCRTVARMPESNAIAERVRSVVKQEATTMRALELVMYCAALENRTYAEISQPLSNTR